MVCAVAERDASENTTTMATGSTKRVMPARSCKANAKRNVLVERP